MKVPELLELKDPEDDLALQAYLLYETSFPVEERAPLTAINDVIRQQKEGVSSSDSIYRYWVAVNDGKLIGLSIYGYYREPRLAFLWYLAIQPELRGRGLGGWLLRRTVEFLPSDALALSGRPALGMCWEVERPVDVPMLEEQALRERRINFYKRHGAIVLEDIRFKAPPIDEGMPPVPYYLMFLPVPGQLIQIDQSLKRAVIEATLIYGYGVDHGSTYYQEAIASIST